MRKKLVALCGLVGLLASTASFAAYEITNDELTKFIDEAVAFAQKSGKDAALKEFNTKGGKFWRHNGELYIFAYTIEGVNLALPNNPALVGKSLLSMKDSDGMEMIKKFIEVAQSPAKRGTVDYRWSNPASKKVEKKHSIIVGMGDWLLGSGYYVKE